MKRPVYMLIEHFPAAWVKSEYELLGSKNSDSY